MLDVILLWAGVIVLFLIGLIGVFVPVVPGVGVVFGGVLLYAAVTGFESISVLTVIIFGILTALAWGADYAGAALGAKYGGGNAPTVVGSVIGSLLGLLLIGPVGLFLGAFLGALGGALYEGQAMTHASRAAFYAIVGMLGATVVQFVLAISIAVAFLVAVLV